MSDWSTFRKSAAKSGRGRDYEPLGSGVETSLRLQLTDDWPGRALFFAKPYLLQQWLDAGTLPANVAVLVRYGLPTKASLDLVERVTLRWGVSLGFVGDLDPMDLTVFAAWRCGDADLKAPRKSGLAPFNYVGINDYWLRLCERYLLPGTSLDRLLIRMSPIEREHFEVVQKMLGPDLRKQVGPRCLALLRSGRKLELEGASNPAFYRRGFAVQLLKHLAA